MSEDINFQDLDAAVAELLNDSHDDAAASHGRDEIVSSEKAEVREQWHLPRESENKLAADKAKNFAKNEKTAAVPAARHQAGRRGHFMDIVHPSSDATLAKKPNHASAANSHIAHAERIAERLAETESAETAEMVSHREQTPVDDRRATESPEIAPKNLANNSTTPKPVEQSPFLADVKVDKTPLGATKPTGAAPVTEELLPVDENPSTNPVDPKPETELSEDNFISRFLADIADKSAASKPTVTDSKISSKPTPRAVHDDLDHLSRDNTEQAPIADRRAKLDSSMIRPQYSSSETAQIAEAPTPFRAVVANENADIAKPKRHVVAWILFFIFLLAIGFCLGAWWWLTH